MARVLGVPIEELRERAGALRAEALALLDGEFGRRESLEDFERFRG